MCSIITRETMKFIIALLTLQSCLHYAFGSADCWSDVDSSNTANVVCTGLDGSTVNVLISTLDAAVTATGGTQMNVELRESNITDLPTTTFTGYPIRSLSLYNDHLTGVPTALLTNVDPNLVVLDLSHNDISNIQSTDISTLPFVNSLQILVLAENQITTLTSNLFLPLTKLKKLLLQLNQITSLGDNTFTDLNELTELHLYANQINQVSIGAFGLLSNLKVLFLNGNSISTFGNGTFTDIKFPTLSKIFLGNNPFICDCPLDWFKTWLTTRSLDVGSDPTCVFPSFNPFQFLQFCSPTNADGVDKDVMDAYLNYVAAVSMNDPRERSFRINKLKVKLLETSQNMKMTLD